MKRWLFTFHRDILPVKVRNIHTATEVLVPFGCLRYVSFNRQRPESINQGNYLDLRCKSCSLPDVLLATITTPRGRATGLALQAVVLETSFEGVAVT